MNFYIMLTLLVAGGIGMSFLVSTTYYYENQSRDNLIKKYCPTMKESCLDTLIIDPFLSMPVTIGWFVYVIFCAKQLLGHKRSVNISSKEDRKE